MSVIVPLKASEERRTTKTKQNRYRGINLSCIHYLDVLFHLLPVCFGSLKESFCQTLPVMPYETLIFLMHAYDLVTRL